MAKLDSVSLSNNTVKRRIEEMSVDITDQVIAGVRDSKFGFALQLDESTDVTNCCQLLVYVRFTQNDAVKTELLLNHEASTTSKEEDIFNCLDNFFKENELDWGNLFGCTTDGAPSMLGRKSGFQAHVKAVSPRVISVYCFIHRFALCTKVLPAKLLMCLNRVVKIVNFVKTSALNTRLFKVLCESLGSDHTCLLYHTEVRWLSRGNTTKRFFEMRNELLLFFQQKDHDFQNDLEDEEFIVRLAYLSDIFEVFNHLNLSFQGQNCTVVDFVSKLGAFIRKLDLWRKNVENKRYDMFKFLSALEVEISDDFSREITQHLSLLTAALQHYFPDITSCPYITDPFSVDPADLPVDAGEQEELIDMQEDQTAKKQRKECSAINFWLGMASSYPTLASHAVPQLLIFPSTWECEQEFSILMNIKSKNRNRLSAPGHDFRCAISKVMPRIDQLVKDKQKSH